MKRSWISMVIVAGTLGLLTLFLGLQYRWLTEVSDAERERMQKRAESDAARFAEDFNREMQAAYYNFQSSASTWKGSSPAEFNERYDYWLTKTAYPDLIREIYFVGMDPSAKPLRYDVANRLFAQADPPPSLVDLRARFSDEKGFRSVYPEAHAMVLPIYEDHKGIEEIFIRRGPAPPPPRMKLAAKHGWLVIFLDAEVLRNRILPAISAKYFPEGNYGVEVVDQAGQAFYSPAGGLDNSDATAGLFDLSPDKLLFYANREMLPRSAEKHDMVINQRVESHTFTARTEKGEDRGGTLKVEVQGPIGNSRPRTAMIARTTDDGPPWTLRVQHTSGSIDQFVLDQRNKSFLLGLGIYILLVGAILAIVLSSLRSRAFAQRQIDFVSSVSHEFRTPLSVIYSAGENLADGVAHEQTQVSRYGELIKGEGRKLSAMVEQILEFAGANAGRQRYNFSPTSVSAVVNEAIEGCRTLIESGGVTVEKDLSDGLQTVSADRAALAGAIRNLIANSIKYGDGANWIKVSAQNGGGWVKIIVEDKGIGIHPDELNRIFEPFYRSREVVDAQISGNGLGLNLVKKIVEAHGGRVSAESRHGEGSKFTIELPQN